MFKWQKQITSKWNKKLAWKAKTTLYFIAFCSGKLVKSQSIEKSHYMFFTLDILILLTIVFHCWISQSCLGENKWGYKKQVEISRDQISFKYCSYSWFYLLNPSNRFIGFKITNGPFNTPPFKSLFLKNILLIFCKFQRVKKVHKLPQLQTSFCFIHKINFDKIKTVRILSQKKTKIWKMKNVIDNRKNHFHR